MRLIPILLIAACLGGCAMTGGAMTGGERLPTCDGKHRRPANPHGSVLLPTAGQPQASAAGASAPILTSASPAGSCR